MVRLALIVTILAMLGLVTASAGQRSVHQGLNPEGQPRGMGKGSTHRYLIWHDNQGWHLRTTTARDQHRFHGEVLTDNGRIYDLSTFRRERNDWVQIAPQGQRIFFDLSTDEGLDGFDFKSDAQNIRFRLLMDNKDRPDLVYVGLTGSNPREIPFSIVNPDAKSKREERSGAQPLQPFGKPEGMGEGSTQRYLLWRDKFGLWHLRTTTARKRHLFSGEIEAQGGRIYELRTVKAEKKDWVNVRSDNHIVFDLTTEGAIDGFDFRTDAKNLKFHLRIDGEEHTDLVYIGARAGNPPAIPFTLSAR
ncbi:MAG: hypothetical protein AB1489_00165 [Acidobacteriota bacterium]